VSAGSCSVRGFKGGLHSLTRALAVDHATEPIRVNSMSSGPIRTRMLEHASAHFSPELPGNSVVERFGVAHPLGRVGTVEEVAALAAFLL
jgi:meso-butanediol dehydrogenase / (S,S)-butanediol dehydrogenase / diacetyl reductase